MAACVVCARSSWAQTSEPPAAATPAPPAATAASGTTSFLAENVTRAELWRYFQPDPHPPPGGGRNPDYTFVGTRFTLGATYRGSRWSADGALQYVRLDNLPTGSVGPGFFGNGGAYFFHANGRFSYQFYLRRLSLGWRDAASGTWVEAGRFSRAAGTDVPSGDATIDRTVADELNGRLLGDAEWSFYQRAWDGVRGGVARGGVAATVTAAVPTQGTFEESANLPIDRLRVGAIEVTLAPGRLVPRTRVEAFAMFYDDRRRVTGRPDNAAANPVARAVDVQVTTVGASIAGAYPSRWGRSDLTAWGAVQTGSWYGHSHRAASATASVGHRLTGVLGRPWMRAGTVWASGDGDPADDRHGTFFPMLPSSDRVSRLNAYALMNVVDHWATLELAPHAALDLTGGLHRVSLATGADGWYQGSGASQRAGTYVGVLGLPTRGAERLGTVVETSATWRARRWWTVRGYVGRMAGGDVVAQNFAGRRLVSGWLESTLRF